MKVAVASSGLGHMLRGVEAWAQDLASALHERNVSVTLFKGGGAVTCDYEHVLPCIHRDSTVARALLSLTGGRYIWRWGLGTGYDLEQWTFALLLVPYLRRHAIDLVHLQDPMAAAILQRLAHRGFISSRVILGHGTAAHSDFLARFRYVHELSPSALEMSKQAGAARATWTMIPNFVDTTRYCPGDGLAMRRSLQIPSDANVVLCAAAIKKSHKRIDYLMHEFQSYVREARDSSTYLVIAGGRDADTEQLLACGRAMLGDRVRFLVEFDRNRMPALYRAANLFVLTSLVEPFGIVLLEAMATGIPCIVNADPVLAWVTGPGGLRIDMTRAGELTRALKLLKDVHRVRELGRHAMTHCRATFGKEVVANQILDYYRFVLDDATSSHLQVDKHQASRSSAGTIHQCVSHSRDAMS